MIRTRASYGRVCHGGHLAEGPSGKAIDLSGSTTLAVFGLSFFARWCWIDLVVLSVRGPLRLLGFALVEAAGSLAERPTICTVEAALMSSPSVLGSQYVGRPRLRESLVPGSAVTSVRGERGDSVDSEPEDTSSRSVASVLGSRYV